MEKKICHYSLKLVKKLISENKYIITRNAQKTAFERFGFSEEEILKEIIELESMYFYKSMTSHNDHRLWQDVYKKEIINIKAYIKIQIVNQNTVIISFKGAEDL
ncbi:type II toxin-antitoxin system MqsR family toxin [Leptospira adleri]|uniref:Toxin-antitoxin system, toxin component n=1 Tax=Leptospira adleri TaxID=2023186 RepID=A0ABX4NV01_9LEPT|nr:type II toxin-antitoxin system MqsR family toxin [Leptospira adleri]PJZ59590.1 toxin-antitoxin system, toxin component [Leptospira adleri]TGM58564.1 type II toxin-antitoxin system MqsR family toxin [Leptospira adleri]